MDLNQFCRSPTMLRYRYRYHSPCIWNKALVDRSVVSSLGFFRIGLQPGIYIRVGLLGGKTAKASVLAAAGWFRLDSEGWGGDFAFPISSHPRRSLIHTLLGLHALTSYTWSW